MQHSLSHSFIADTYTFINVKTSSSTPHENSISCKLLCKVLCDVKGCPCSINSSYPLFPHINFVRNPFCIVAEVHLTPLLFF